VLEPSLALCLNFDACWQEIVKQAVDAIQTAGASMQEMNASMPEKPKILAPMGRRNRHNGYDADVEGVCDKHTSPKSKKVLKIHIRTSTIAFIQLNFSFIAGFASQLFSAAECLC
jgi:hypothetical protein